MKIPFVSANPICGDVVLRFWKVEPPPADQFAKPVFKRVFGVGVPYGLRVGFGPEVANVVCAPQCRRNQVVKLVFSGLRGCDSVFL